MSDLQTPYHYARDHYGDGHWCVRGPGDFYLSVPEKNLAWCVAAMLNGHGAEAGKEARKLMGMLERDGPPVYLKEPCFIETRRQQANRTCVADPKNLNMVDRIQKRLDQGWSPYKGETMIGVMLDVLAEPTEGMILAVCDEAKKEQMRPVEVHRRDAASFIEAAIKAAKDGK